MLGCYSTLSATILRHFSASAFLPKAISRLLTYILNQNQDGNRIFLKTIMYKMMFINFFFYENKSKTEIVHFYIIFHSVEI